MGEPHDSLADIQAVIITVLRTYLPHAAGDISPEIAPIDELEDFDSLCAIEVVVELSERLGLEIEEDVFLKPKPRSRKHATIAEVSQIVHERISKK